MSSRLGIQLCLDKGPCLSTYDTWMHVQTHPTNCQFTIVVNTCVQASDAETVTVIQEDFWDALSVLQPSLSNAELQRYKKLRDHYESRGR